jgi:CheY-like chemotaxis protein
VTTGVHTVLLVEDDDDVRAAYAAYLEGAGYVVVEAGDGREALQRLRAAPDAFCLILLDLFMPTMDGWTFRKRQLRDPAMAAIPVVVISADPDVVPTAAALGAVGSMRKPLDLRLLLETVARHC